MPVRDFAPGFLGPQAAEWLSGRRGEPVEPRYAATVMLVRDALAPSVWSRPPHSTSPEVFMLRRVASMDFAPRTWVFPGGGVDPRDNAPELPWAGPSPAEWAALMGCEEGLARSLVCAAVREVFEECGVLLAGPSVDSVVADLRAPEWDAERAALLTKEQSFAELLLRRDLVLRSDLLSAQGRWVTPEFERRRYDTFFFAALLPEGQIPDDDTSEADHADWTVPAELLAAYERGEAIMLPPTVVSVERVRDAASAADFVATPRPSRAVVPQLVEVAGQPMIRADLP
jgi:8-oxo-dGTP pyrophosphatase MutT (NUDIX family)